MAIEMSSNEVIDFAFSQRMQILELVHSRELDYIETIRQNTICEGRVSNRLSTPRKLRVPGFRLSRCSDS